MAFEVPTTIILGAGASAGYGYPTGDTLIEEIISKTIEWRNKEYDLAPKSDPDFNALIKLEETLSFFDPLSIDAFLQHYASNKKFIEVAKRAIAYVVLLSGDEGGFNRGEKDKSGDLANWYRFLWDAIVSGQEPEEIANSKKPFLFNIITFNYDTSLERFLYTRVTSRNSMFTQEQQVNVLAKLRKCINHVYGELPHYKWMGGDKEDKALWKGDAVSTKILAKEIHENIKLIGERKESDYARVQNNILKAQQVVFLGFGFDDTNIGEKVLNLTETLNPYSLMDGKTYPKSSRTIKYTNYGDSEIINNKINSIIDSANFWAKEEKSFANRTSSESGDRHDYEGYTADDFYKSAIKSTKKVYQALEQDFALNRI